jgi:ADP-heptose:LPS heptosyltransferase
VKTVVISRPDRVGDVIVSSACLPLLRELHPGARLILIARSIMQPLFAAGGVVDGFIPYDGYEDEQVLHTALEHYAPEVIYHLQPDNCIQLIAEQCGIPKRVGFSINGDRTGLTKVFPYRKCEGTMHEAAYCRQLLVDASGELGENLPPATKPCLGVEPEALKRLQKKAAWLREDEIRIAINPTAARILLRWPAEYFDQLMHTLVAPGRRLILIGHPENDPSLVLLRKLWQQKTGKWSDLGGQLDLAETATLLRHCALHISRDTGTSHLAAAMECPSVVIFARLDAEYGPVRWRPLGENSQLVKTQAQKRWWETRRHFWKRSFRSIEPQRVIAAAEELLDRKPRF